MTKGITRIISLIMIFALVFSSVPAAVLATGAEPTEPSSSEPPVEEPPAEEPPAEEPPAEEPPVEKPPAVEPPAEEPSAVEPPAEEPPVEEPPLEESYLSPLDGGGGPIVPPDPPEGGILDGAFYYVVNDDNTATIVGADLTLGFRPLTIPDEVGGLTVTAIGDNAFKNNGSYFAGALTIPETVTTIGDSAFSGMYTLTGALTIPSSVTTIGARAFSGCGFTGTLTIPSSVRTIGDNAFAGCTRFNALSLSNGLETIGAYAFSSCGFTGDLTIPDSVVTVGNYAFNRCQGFNGALTLSSGLTTIGDYAFSECRYFTGSLTIPGGVETISKRAFYACGFDGTLTIEDGVTTIGEEAFEYVVFTGALSIPGSVRTIGDSAFLGCHFDGTLTIEDGVTTIGEYAFGYGNSFAGALTIPDSVTTIGASAFKDCEGFNGALTLSSGVTVINDYVFSGCGFTGALTIPSGITTIGASAFSGCGFTGTLTIPDSVTTIGEDAFGYGNSFAGALTIPDSVTTIGASAFKDCEGFNGALTLSSGVTVINDYVFSGCGFTGDLTIPSGVTTIGSYAFGFGNSFTGALTIPDSVTTIGASAFSGCGFTGSLTIPSGVTTIGSYAFSACRGFTGSLTIPDSVTTIGAGAFTLCSGLTGTLTLPAGLTTINNKVFYGCNGLTGTLTIPSGVTTIGEQAFEICRGLTGTLTIPSGITNIGDSAFKNCSGFTGTVRLTNCAAVALNAFEGCSVTLEYYGEQGPATWSALAYALENASTDPDSPTLITLAGNITAPEALTMGEGATFAVASGRYVILDLNGMELNAAGTNTVFRNDGNLEITDNSVAQNGCLYPSGNSYTTLYNKGALKLTAGAIGKSDKTVRVLNTTDCSFEMTGGAIYGYLDNNGQAVLDGGTINGTNSSVNYTVRCTGGSLKLGATTLTAHRDALMGIGSSPIELLEPLSRDIRITIGTMFTLDDELKPVFCSSDEYSMTQADANHVIPAQGSYLYTSFDSESGVLSVGVTEEGRMDHALNRGESGEYTLQEDITLTADHYITGVRNNDGTANAALNLNGHNIYCGEFYISLVGSDEKSLTFDINPGSILPAADGGTITGTGEYVLALNDNVTLYLNSVTVVNTSEEASARAIQNNGGAVVASRSEISGPRGIVMSGNWGGGSADLGAQTNITLTGADATTRPQIELGAEGILSITEALTADLRITAQTETERIVASAGGSYTITSSDFAHLKLASEDSYELELREGEVWLVDLLAPQPGSENFEYTDNGDGTATITGLKDEVTPSGDLIIPSVIGRLPVTAIGNDSFSDCRGFNGALTIPNGVTTIGDSAFYNCKGLTGAVTIPSSIVSIGSNPFAQTTLSSINVSEDNQNYKSIGGVLYSKDGATLIGAPAGLTGSLTIPSGVTTIGDDAFYRCSGLTGALTIPDGVTTIGKSAFFECVGFDGALTIPSGVTTIGNYAFTFCSGFTGALTIPNTVTSIGNSAFYNCSGLTGALTIPDGVTTIGASAFNGCSGLTGALTIPNGVTTIGASAFRNCEGFDGALTIPNTVTSIGNYAFDACSGLTGAVYIPLTVTLGTNAFRNCNNLTVVRGDPPGDPPAQIEVSTHTALQAAFAGASTDPDNVTNIKMTASIFYATPFDDGSDIPLLAAGRYVKLDLNGCTLSNTTPNMCTLDNAGNLEIIDSSADGSGKITGGDSLSCIVYNFPTGTLKLTSGTLCGLTAGKERQAVCNDGVFIMTGGQLGLPGNYAFIESRAWSANCSTTLTGGTIYARRAIDCEFGSTLKLGGVTFVTGSDFWRTVSMYVNSYEKRPVAPIEILAPLNQDIVLQFNEPFEKDEEITVVRSGDGYELTPEDAEHIVMRDGYSYYTLRYDDTDHTIKLILEEEGRMLLHFRSNIYTRCVYTLQEDVTLTDDRDLPCGLSGEYPGYHYSSQLNLNGFTINCGEYKLDIVRTNEYYPAAFCINSDSTVGGGRITGEGDYVIRTTNGVDLFVNNTTIENTASPENPPAVSDRYHAIKNDGVVVTVTDSVLSGARGGLFNNTGNATISDTVCMGAAGIDIKSGVVTLGAGANPGSVNFVATGTSLKGKLRLAAALSNNIEVMADVAANNYTVADAGQGYTITQADLAYMLYNGDAQLRLNESTNTIRFYKAPPTAITLNKTSLSLDLGASEQLTATITPSVHTGRIDRWTTTDPTVATVDNTGFVTAGTTPGTARITVYTNNNKYAICTVKVYAVAPTQSLTAAFDAPIDKIGLQRGSTSAMRVYGLDKTTPLPAALFTFESSNPNVASVNADGLVTAGATPGTATIKAVLENDPNSRVISLPVKVIARQAASLELTGVEETDSQGKVIIDNVNDIVPIDQTDARAIAGGYKFRISAEAYDGSNPRELLQDTKVTWASSDTSIATVKANADGTATVTVLGKNAGECVITATASDLAKKTASFEVWVRDYSPRLDAASVTLNPQLEAGVDVPLLESFGNGINNVSLHEYDAALKGYDPNPSDRLTVSYSNDVLTVNNLDGEASAVKINNGTIKTQLWVTCGDGNTYELPLNVTIKNVIPALMIKQPTRFNLFYKDSAETLTAYSNGLKVTDMEFGNAVDTSFALSYDGTDAAGKGSATIEYKVQRDPTLGYVNGRLSARALLKVSFEGYNWPVEKTITIGTATIKPSLALSSASSVISTVYGEKETTFTVVDSKTKLPFTGLTAALSKTAPNGIVTLTQSGDDIMLTLKDMGGVYKGGTATINVKETNWLEAIPLTHRVTVQNTLPTAKASRVIKLSSVFTETVDLADAEIKLSQTNAPLIQTRQDLNPVRPNANTSKLDVYYENGMVYARVTDPTITNGTYAYSLTPKIENGSGGSIDLKPITVSVNLTNATPSVKAAKPIPINKAAYNSSGTTNPSGTTTVVVTNSRDALVLARAGNDPQSSLFYTDAGQPLNTLETGTKALQADKLSVVYQNGEIKASLDDGGITTGSYRFKLPAKFIDGSVEREKGFITVTVTVADRAPKVTLASATLRLNRNLTGEEAVSLFKQNADFKVVGAVFEQVTYPASGSLIFNFSETGITASGSGLTANGTYSEKVTLTVEERTTGKEITLAPLTFRVTVYAAAPTVTVSAKGKLDVLDRANTYIDYTITRFSNVVGTVDTGEAPTLTGADCNKFTVEYAGTDLKGNPIVRLWLKELVSYSTAATYRVNITVRLNGIAETVSTPLLSVRVVQSAVKAAASYVKQNVYQSAGSNKTYRSFITLISPTFGEIESVAVNTATSRQLLSAVNITDVQIGTDSQGRSAADVSYKITKPSLLKVNATYTLVLDVIPENAATNVKPTQIRISIKTMR